jgi:putative transposase
MCSMGSIGSPELTRACAFRFALDPTSEQEAVFWRYAGARRYAYNHHLARVRNNLEQRAVEIEAGVAREDLTAGLSWSRFSFINEFNAWKTGRAADSPVNDDGTVGLAWRDEVCADVFECASVDAATALKNWKESNTGARKGRRVGFPRFAARHRATPRFRLRSKAKTGSSMHPVRCTGPKLLRLPTIGDVRVHGCTRRLRRMMAAGRFHPHSASVSYSKGRWWVSVQGVAAKFHHQRRSRAGRHARPAGLDAGVKHLVVVADTDGQILRIEDSVRALNRAQAQLKRANQALARTKPGSVGRARAKARLKRIHARIAWIRHHQHHQLSHWAATTLSSLTVEDLNVAGMTQLRSLARHLADAGIGDLSRMLGYKSGWYGLDLVEADRWFPSSKTCSNCGDVRAELGLDERIYRCSQCRASIDRDVNAAINLARWPGQHTTSSPPRAAAA